MVCSVVVLIEVVIIIWVLVTDMVMLIEVGVFRFRENLNKWGLFYKYRIFRYNFYLLLFFII